MNTRQVFDTLAYSGLNWPGKTTLLQPDSLQDYLQRPGSGAISIAELYHENSKLHASKAAGLLAFGTGLEQFRRETVERSATATTSPGRLSHSAPDYLLDVLGAAAGTSVDVFYAVELRVLVDGWILTYDALHRRTAALKHMDDRDASTVRSALALMGRGETWNVQDPIVFVLGWFARNDLLFGSRGYRRTLIEAGQVLQALLQEAQNLRLKLDVHTEFTDADIDGVLNADGVEQGTLAAVVIRQSDDE
jgi:hypothetical protein